MSSNTKNNICMLIKGVIKCLLMTAYKVAVYAASLLGWRVVPAFWAHALNFGDLITPLLLKHYGVLPLLVHDIDTICSDKTIVACGSILGWQRQSYSGYVLGSGLGLKQEAKPMPYAKFLAVRGRLTRDAMKLKEDVLLGDPGLLAEKLVDVSRVTKKYCVGIVPHQIEYKSPLVADFVNRIAQSVPDQMRVKLISTRRLPGAVIKDIAACDFIISSSLHGLVVADALCIPNARIHIDANLADFKFEDYYSAYEEKCQTFELSELSTYADVISICRYPAYRAKLVKKYKEDLNKAFEKYVREVS